ncbi:MAG TPA: asparagine synthase (glutamine-hydrolyzing) [Nannocystis exedens]|nr:asparagine synthase (glutamine-hydrolyzing) [Nannocystis exedens]
MCGIAGIVGDGDRELCLAMTQTLAHRGPDSQGIFFDVDVDADADADAGKDKDKDKNKKPRPTNARGSAALGHRRLAIIGLDGGVQPMCSQSGRFVITYNGELYNYRELRAELQGMGVRIGDSSDTAVMLAAFEHWGLAAAERFVGMYALGLWDRHQQKLTLLRDRVGIKPLYYAILPRGARGDGPPSLAFASEPKSLLTLPAVDRKLSATALDAYLGLLYVPPPLSMFRGIAQLPPGHRLTWHRGQVSVERIWDAEPAPEAGRTHEEWAEIVAPILEQAIRDRLVADVPVGAFLSGGVDSSTIVALMAAQQSRPLTTVCVGYDVDGGSYDERVFARRIAKVFATDHHELVLDISILDDLEALVRGFDEPFGSWAALLSWHLCRFTRGKVKVAVAGDGGDEVFGGYPRYRGMLLSGIASRAPNWGLAVAGRALAASGEATVARSYRRWARSFIDGCRSPAAERYAGWVGYLSTAERDQLLTPSFRARVRTEGRLCPVEDAFRHPLRGDLVARSTYADLHGFLPENVLRSSDRMSMAHGLEVRVPLCDHRLVEVMARVPSRHKVGALASKRLLKTIVGKRLPREVTRRRKLGFNAPFGAWMKRPANAERIRQTWLNPETIAARGMLDPQAVDRLWNEHQRGSRDHGPLLWALIVLETWQRLYL